GGPSPVAAVRAAPDLAARRGGVAPGGDAARTPGPRARADRRSDDPGVGRGVIVCLMTRARCAVVTLLITVVFTSLAEQLSKLVQDFPALRDRVDQRVPAHYPTLKRIVREIFALP